MKILLGSAVGLVAVVALVLMVGMMLPERHLATVEAEYRAPAGVVYAAINDVSQGPTWRSGLNRVEVLSHPGEPVRWHESADWGELTFVQDENRPNQRIVSRIIDEGQGFGGTWTYEIDSTASGTGLRITERGQVSNPLFRFISRFITGYHHGLETYVRDLGRHLGEEVVATRR